MSTDRPTYESTNQATAVKRGLYTVHENLVIKAISKLSDADAKQLEQSLRG